MGMKPGDHAGLIALQSRFGTVGIKVKEDGMKYVAMCATDENGNEKVIESVRFDGREVYLKLHFVFENSIDLASFSYSDDGQQWTPIGMTLIMRYTLDHFMGYRMGLFNYATRHIGGHADFDYFKYERGASIYLKTLK